MDRRRPSLDTMRLPTLVLTAVELAAALRRPAAQLGGVADDPAQRINGRCAEIFRARYFS
jgi:hypothetical protein